MKQPNFTAQEIAWDKRAISECCYSILNYLFDSNYFSDYQIRPYALKLACIYDKYQSETTWITDLIDSYLRKLSPEYAFRVKEMIDYWRK